MQVIIYACDSEEISVQRQLDECRRYAEKCNHSIADEVIDLDGDNFHMAIDKMINDSNIDCIVIYHNSPIEYLKDLEDVIFFIQYLKEFNKKLVFVN